MTLESTGTPSLYLGFTLLVIVLLAVDFFVLKAQGAHRVWATARTCLNLAGLKLLVLPTTAGKPFALHDSVRL